MGLFSKKNGHVGWVAIALQSDGTRVVHMTRSAQAGYTVESTAFFPMDGQMDAAQLEKISRESHLGRYRCTTLLAASEYQLLSVEAPNVPQDELKTAIRWRLKDMLDYRVDDATIDVLDIPIEKNAPARAHSMYVVAAHNRVIEQRQALFSDAKIPLSVIDIPEMAQRNLSALIEPEGRGLAMLSFDADGGLLTVSFGGELYLSRRIDVGVMQLVHAQADERDAYFERITLELQRSLDHFERQYHFIAIAKLMLCPLPNHVSELKAHLSANLYLPVETFNLGDMIDISRTPELKSVEIQQQYLLTIGAALRHEEVAL